MMNNPPPAAAQRNSAPRLDPKSLPLEAEQVKQHIETLMFNDVGQDKKTKEDIQLEIRALKAQMSSLLDKLYTLQANSNTTTTNEMDPAWYMSMLQEFPFIFSVVAGTLRDVRVNMKYMPLKFRYRGDAAFYMTSPIYNFGFTFTPTNYHFVHRDLPHSCHVSHGANNHETDYAERFVFKALLHPHASGSAFRNRGNGEEERPVFSDICTGVHNRFPPMFQTGKGKDLPTLTNMLRGALRWVETINVNDTYSTALIRKRTGVANHFWDRGGTNEHSFKKELGGNPSAFVEKVMCLAEQATAYMKLGLQHLDAEVFDSDLLQHFIDAEAALPPSQDVEYQYPGIKAMGIACRKFQTNYAELTVLDIPMFSTESIPAHRDEMVNIWNHVPNQVLQQVLPRSDGQQTTDHDVALALGRYNAVLAMKNVCQTWLMQYWIESCMDAGNAGNIGMKMYVQMIVCHDLVQCIFEETNPVMHEAAYPFVDYVGSTLMTSYLTKYQYHVYAAVCKAAGSAGVQGVQGEHAGSAGAPGEHAGSAGAPGEHAGSAGAPGVQDEHAKPTQPAIKSIQHIMAEEIGTLDQFKLFLQKHAVSRNAPDLARAAGVA